MGIELECGSCNERLSVEASDGIVVCPHCQMALQIPDVPDSPQESSDESAATVAMQPLSAVSLNPSISQDDPTTFPGLPIGEDDLPTDQFPAMGDAVGDEEPQLDATELISTSDAVSEVDSDSVAVETSAVETSQGDETDAVVEPSEQEALAEFDTTEIAEQTIRLRKSAGGVSRFLFILLLGYASAVTIALIWLWFARGRVHPLESLPDMTPKHAYLVPEDVPLPPGHTLRLGETRRFGNVEVTALRVTRGVAVLVNRDQGTEEETLGETLKLHLRLRNVSRDQTFAPIGRRLLLTRDGKRANNFVYFAGQTGKQSLRLLPFPLRIEETSVEIKGQQLDRKLEPAEEFEIDIATDDNIPALKGKLVWRVHLRKGLNPDSGRGVTTLIEFTFDSSEILADSPNG